MKKLFMLGALLTMMIACSQPKTAIEKAELFQSKLNKEFANKDSSPLPPDAIKKFTTLDFYPIEERYIIQAKLTLTPEEKPFEMPTTTERKPVYVKYGVLNFLLSGKEHQLDIYQDVNIREKKEYANHLFLPFTDLTSGVSSYGGGRYLDLEIPKTDSITLNFNMAYNPYCVYNPKFSCPIPPAQNFIEAEINAGVKDYKYE